MKKLLVVFLMLVLGISCFGYYTNNKYSPRSGHVGSGFSGDRKYYKNSTLNDIARNYNNSEMTDDVLEIIKSENPLLDLGCDYTGKEIFYLFLEIMETLLPDGSIETYFKQTSKNSFRMLICWHDLGGYGELDGPIPYKALSYDFKIKNSFLNGEYFIIKDLKFINYYGKLRNYESDIINREELAAFLTENYSENREILEKIKDKYY